ncbi:hypothetical protein B0J17DRAFT_708350 [Rhizoctonia solani]|nr:hypothetical protein B0J17DRAFT_708350 [Rhizoctonia solani]
MWYLHYIPTIVHGVNIQNALSDDAVGSTTTSGALLVCGFLALRSGFDDRQKCLNVSIRVQDSSDLSAFGKATGSLNRGQVRLQRVQQTSHDYGLVVDNGLPPNDRRFLNKSDTGREDAERQDNRAVVSGPHSSWLLIKSIPDPELRITKPDGTGTAIERKWHRPRYSKSRLRKHKADREIEVALSEERRDQDYKNVESNEKADEATKRAAIIKKDLVNSTAAKRKKIRGQVGSKNNGWERRRGRDVCEILCNARPASTRTLAYGNLPPSLERRSLCGVHAVNQEAKPYPFSHGI